jgi:hypothetical protein
MEKPKKDPPCMRDLMPENYTVTLAAQTGCKNVSNLSQIVRLEHTKSKYWPAVEALAKATNPHGFLLWKAARNLNKLPAVAQAA